MGIWNARQAVLARMMTVLLGMEALLSSSESACCCFVPGCVPVRMTCLTGVVCRRQEGAVEQVQLLPKGVPAPRVYLVRSPAHRPESGECFVEFATALPATGLSAAASVCHDVAETPGQLSGRSRETQPGPARGTPTSEFEMLVSISLAASHWGSGRVSSLLRVAVSTC